MILKKNKKINIVSIIEYLIFGLIVIIGISGYLFDNNELAQYRTCPRITHEEDAVMLGNYTGKVIITGVLNCDGVDSEIKGENYSYCQTVVMKRITQYSIARYRKEISWINETQNPQYGVNAKIYGFDIDLTDFDLVYAEDSGIIEVNDHLQYQLFSIKNGAEVTIFAEWYHGKFMSGKVLSWINNIDVVTEFLSGDMTTEVVFSADYHGIKFVSLIISALVLYVIIRYVFMIPILDNRKSRNIFHILLLIAGIAYELTDMMMISSMLSLFFLLLLIRKSETRKLWTFPIFVAASGLKNGITYPIVMVPARFMEEAGYESAGYRAIVYALFSLASLLFFFIGKKWRGNFKKQMEGRKIAFWEMAIAFFTGLLITIYDAVVVVKSDYLFGSSNINIQIMSIAAYWIGFLTIVLAAIVITVIMIANKRSYYIDKVNDMQFNIIVMMAEIVENRDSNTGGHIRRTARYVEILADELKNQGKYKALLTDQYISDMKLAATLHDIGKIHVSDAILNKPGRLNDEEFDIMKTHVEEGIKLLKNAKAHLGDFEYLNVALEMAGGHHEWWDGTAKGYPNHIKGEEIPLCARIMAVADVFDALTSKRVYKDSMPIETAYEIICSEKGTHFDPDIIDAFVATNEKFGKTLEEYRSVD